MAKGARIVGLDAYMRKWSKATLDYLVKEQNAILVKYADDQMRLIGDAIQLYNSRHHMDRTGNLLDSLCWVVSYNGSLVKSGYYREQKATKDSYLHELFGNKESAVKKNGVSGNELLTLYPVYGHALADDFIKRWGKKSGQGQWLVAWGILAPYWGYWEVGHQNILTHRYEKFAIMAQFFDKVTKELKPAKTDFIRSRPSYTLQKFQKMLKSFSNNPYRERRHFKSYPSHNPR